MGTGFPVAFAPHCWQARLGMNRVHAALLMGLSVLFGCHQPRGSSYILQSSLDDMRRVRLQMCNHAQAEVPYELVLD